MEEKEKKNQMHDGSMCGGWCGCGHRHFLLRWVLGVMILVFVFALGVKIGEIKGAFEAEYGGYMGYHHMMYRGGYGIPYPMMPVVHVQGSPATGAPATSTP